MWPTNKAKKAMCPRRPIIALMKNGKWVENWDEMKEELVCTVSVLGGYYRVTLGELDLGYKYDGNSHEQRMKNEVFERALDRHTGSPIRIK